MKFNFNPFPVLISENLVLKQAKNSDWEEVLFLRSNKEVNEFVKRPLSNNKENALAFIEKVNIGILNNENLYWKITQKKQDKMIGSISLWNFSKDKLTGEVGYDLHPDFHNKGVMSEALKVVMNFGFTILKFDKIEAYTQFDNKKSIGLLLKNNFILNENKKDEDNIKNIVYEINNPLN